MHTPETERAPEANERGLGATAKQVAEHASAIARLEIELATLELKGKVANLGAGIGLGIGAALFALYALGFGFASVAAVLMIFFDAWLALLIVFGGLLLIAALLGVLALSRIKRGTPPVPEQAIAEAKKTQAVLRSNGG
jgi:Putative Actinobacterial Holin-X, holin superfamily III